MLCEYLKENYSAGEPVFSGDIDIPGMTEENIDVLQFLDCLKDVDRCAEEELKICGDILTKYAREHDITRNVIDRFITKYPVKIYKAIYETGVKHVSA